MRVWNTTDRLGVPSTLTLYGMDIVPGKYRDIDEVWVKQNPKPLQAAKSSGRVFVGDSLPEGYSQQVEKQMIRVTNRSGKHKIISGAGNEKLAKTLLRPGESATLDDKEYPETAKALTRDEDFVVKQDTSSTKEEDTSSKEPSPPETKSSEDEEGGEDEEETEEDEDEEGEEETVPEKTSPKTKPRPRKRTPRTKAGKK